jgi:hypothetical protein
LANFRKLAVATTSYEYPADTAISAVSAKPGKSEFRRRYGILPCPKPLLRLTMLHGTSLHFAQNLF